MATTTRRMLLLFLPGACALAAKGRVYPSEIARFADATTEFPVERLTDPAHASLLPFANGRAVSRRSSFLIYAGDQAGSTQLYRLDHGTGAALQLTDAVALQDRTFALIPGDRAAVYVDGVSLRTLTLGNLKERDIYRIREGWTLVPGIGVAADGKWAAIVESRGGVHEVRNVPLRDAPARTMAYASVPITLALPHPQRPEVLYRQGDAELWIAGPNGKKQRLPVAAGTVGSAHWRADGEAVLYLVGTPEGRSEIREFDLRSGADRALAPAFRYAGFAPNGDASVFVGASASVAQPHVILLLRVAKRELVLCEHRARDAGLVNPFFSPDSQRVYFESDRAGKPALYSVKVDRLVEET